jgi:hypothetical protein
MVVEQGPGITQSLRLTEKRTKTADKISAILVIGENLSLRHAANNNVLQQTGNIYAGLTRHEGRVTLISHFVKNVPSRPAPRRKQ